MRREEVLQKKETTTHIKYIALYYIVYQFY